MVCVNEIFFNIKAGFVDNALMGLRRSVQYTHGHVCTDVVSNKMNNLCGIFYCTQRIY
jgi:hypothetical protein